MAGGRPPKTNADWFSHDADMRNDTKIKAVRRKFGHLGYSIWSMLLESLTKSKGIKLEWDELNIELIAGDFDIEPGELVLIISYFEKLKMIEIEDEILSCQKLTDRLKPLFDKRENDRNRNNSKRKPPAKVVTNNGSSKDTELSQIQVVGNPHSKVKESKVNKSKVNILSDDERISVKNPSSSYKEINQIALRLIKFSDNRLQQWQAIEQAELLFKFYAKKDWCFAGGGAKNKNFYGF